MKSFYWLVKREFWEHKGGFFWAPIVTGIVGLVLNVMMVITAEVMGRRYAGSNTHFHSNFDRAFDAKDLVAAGSVLDMTLYGVTFLLLGVMAIVVFFYCLGSLYDDRRDRSILFWKSLPLSDTGTVLSKAASAVVLAPVIAVVVGVIVGLVLVGFLAIVATFHGIPAWRLLMEAHPFRVVGTLIALLPLYAIWALPTLGWLMLCSAWARSKPFLWAIALPVGAGIIVSWFGLMGVFNRSTGWFWTNVVGRLLGSLVPGGWVGQNNELVIMPGHDDPASVLNALDLSYHYSALANPSTWIGAVAGIAMIAGAIWFRRWRDDS
jgi:ABC-2 type transport system permease protein